MEYTSTLQHMLKAQWQLYLYSPTVHSGYGDVNQNCDDQLKCWRKRDKATSATLCEARRWCPRTSGGQMGRFWKQTERIGGGGGRNHMYMLRDLARQLHLYRRHFWRLGGFNFFIFFIFFSFSCMWAKLPDFHVTSPLTNSELCNQLCNKLTKSQVTKQSIN